MISQISGRWLYLPVEVRVREFDARLLLGCCAVERGYNVIIGKKNALTRTYPILPRGIILERSLSRFRELEFDKLVKKGFRLTATDEEGIYFYTHPDGALQQRLSEKNLNMSDWYFSWSKKQAEIINKAYPESSKKNLVIGTYRNDLYHPSFHVIWENQVNNLKEKHGRFILLPSNFWGVLNSHGGKEYLLWQLQHQQAITSESELERHKRELDHEEQALTAYLAVLKNIQEAFPEHKLIVRPHPGEDFNKWMNMAKKIPGILVIHEGPVTPWLIAADVVFHHGCTTGVESYLLGTPAIAYHPCYSQEFDTHLSTLIGPVAKTPAELIDYLQMAIDGRTLPRDDLSWFEEYLVVPDDSYISDRMIDYFDKINIPADRSTSIDRIPSKIKFLFDLMLTKYSRRIKRLKGIKIEPTIATQKFGYMTDVDVSETIKKFNNATGRFSGIKVKKLQGQLFQLTAKV